MIDKRKKDSPAMTATEVNARMADYFQIVKISDQKGYNVIHENGVYMGTFEAGDDGYYVFWPTFRQGYWPAYMLTALGNALDELNKDWDEKVQRELGKHG